jgi:hypothetical protein
MSKWIEVPDDVDEKTCREFATLLKHLEVHGRYAKLAVGMRVRLSDGQGEGTIKEVYPPHNDRGFRPHLIVRLDTGENREFGSKEVTTFG